MVHGHREECEQRAQHEGTGGDVAIVLMDSRAHGGQRDEGDDRAEPPRDRHGRIEAPVDETDQQSAQPAKGDEARPDMLVLDLGRKLEHLAAEPSFPSFVGALALLGQQIQRPFHRSSRAANHAPVLIFR